MTSLTTQLSIKQIPKIAVVVLLVAFGSGLLLKAEPPQAVRTWASMGTIADSSATDSIAIFDPSDNSTSAVGQLTAPRAGHTATVLADDRILVAGGTANDRILNDIEVVDLVAGTSTPISPLVQPRTGHAATRLANDKVLIVGGTSVDGVVLATAEIFDPETSSVSFTALVMSTPRTGASATTLIDGRALVAGGNNGSRNLASAELFYAFDESFAAVNTQLSVARSGHTAVLLPNNNSVLIAGGTSNGTAQASADLFVPVQLVEPAAFGMGTFQVTGSMANARVGAISGPTYIEGYAFVGGGGASSAEAYHFATVKTDREDYLPGMTVTITGSGWQPGETVKLIETSRPSSMTSGADSI